MLFAYSYVNLNLSTQYTQSLPWEEGINEGCKVENSGKTI